jgi:hypothetical protein
MLWLEVMMELRFVFATKSLSLQLPVLQVTCTVCFSLKHVDKYLYHVDTYICIVFFWFSHHQLNLVRGPVLTLSGFSPFPIAIAGIEPSSSIPSSAP